MKKWEKMYAKLTFEEQEHLDDLVADYREEIETMGFGEWVPCSEDDPETLPSMNDTYRVKGTALCNGKPIEFEADVECCRHVENWSVDWEEVDRGQWVFEETYDIVPHWEDEFLERWYGLKDVRITEWKQWEPEANTPYPTTVERITVMLPGETVG